MTAVTRRMQDCLNVIARSEAERGHPPSYDEIMDAMGLRSKSGVSRMVDELVERGMLRRVTPRKGAARSLQIVRRGCPHCGGDLGITSPNQHAVAPGGSSAQTVERGR